MHLRPLGASWRSGVGQTALVGNCGLLSLVVHFLHKPRYGFLGLHCRSVAPYSGPRPVRSSPTGTYPPVYCFRKMLAGGGAKLLVGHHTREDFLVAFHTVDEQFIQNPF